MERDDKTPLLLRFYFGEAAGKAQGGASRRLMKWSRAFDEWMEQQRGHKRKDTLKHALLAWKRLLGHTKKMPWQMERDDVESHVAWLREQGFAESTVNATVGFIDGFYAWSAGRKIDPACGEGFNPARGMLRTSRKPYAGTSVWSREQVQAFLGLVGRDETGLGRRDFALFTARVGLGVPLNKLLGLRWGQIRQDEAGAWVRWRRDGAWMKLPEDVWQAMEAYLRASGRLEGMTAEKYIFVPQVQPSVPGLGQRAEDWLERQALSNQPARMSLKLYGRRVGIEEGKLNLAALRRTAIKLRMQAGASVEEMQVFMDTREKVKSTRYRLRCLVGRQPPSPSGAGLMQPPPNETTHSGEGKETVPVRWTKPFREGDAVTHGLYSRRVDREKVEQVMKENIVGVDEELRCMQELMDRMLEVDEDVERLVEAYSQAMQRMQVLVRHKESPENNEAAQWVEEYMERHAAMAVELGFAQESEREEIKAWRPQAKGDDTTRKMVATVRLMLRNIYTRAMAEGVGDREYLRLVELYGRGCVRLSRMLRAGGDEYVRMQQFLLDEVDRAIRDVGEEMGIYDQKE